VTMSYETCCVLFLSSASSLPFWAWLFPAEIPPICYFPEYLFCPRLERMMEGSRSLVFASSVPVFLPCPFSDFSSFPCHWGTGDLWHCSVSCVMEWNISLAIFLATKRVLSLEAIFSVFWLLARYWMEEDHSHFCSVHWPSSISAQSRLTRVCC